MSELISQSVMQPETGSVRAEVEDKVICASVKVRVSVSWNTHVFSSPRAEDSR